MPIKTKRWDEPTEESDGFRLLVCRYRPRALKREKETWNGWCSDLGPSKQLHAEVYGKKGPPLSWEEFRRRYVEEMGSQAELIEELAALVREGRTVTLLCSASCVDPDHCHRTLLRELIEARVSSDRQ